MKKVRNAVRVFVVAGNKVLCIRYKEENIGYIDIPGGKIEEGETGVEAAIREVREETGIEVNNLEEVGNVAIEYPDRIYNMNVFVANDYKGNARNNEENDAFFINIEDLLKEKKRYAITYLLDTEFEDYFDNRNVNVKFNVDNNHKVINYDKIWNLISLNNK